MRHKISIVERSLRYNGHYEVLEGDVCVESAFGAPRAPAGDDPKTTAETLLRQAVRMRRTQG